MDTQGSSIKVPRQWRMLKSLFWFILGANTVSYVFISGDATSVAVLCVLAGVFCESADDITLLSTLSDQQRKGLKKLGLSLLLFGLLVEAFGSLSVPLDIINYVGSFFYGPNPREIDLSFQSVAPTFFKGVVVLVSIWVVWRFYKGLKD